MIPYPYQCDPLKLVPRSHLEIWEVQICFADATRTQAGKLAGAIDQGQRAIAIERKVSPHSATSRWQVVVRAQA